MLILKEGFNLVVCVKNHVTSPPKHFCILGNISRPLDLQLAYRLCWPPFWYSVFNCGGCFSKWVKVAITNTASSEATLEGLHHICHS